VCAPITSLLPLIANSTDLSPAVRSPRLAPVSVERTPPGENATLQEQAPRQESAAPFPPPSNANLAWLRHRKPKALRIGRIARTGTRTALWARGRRATALGRLAGGHLSGQPVSFPVCPPSETPLFAFCHGRGHGPRSRAQPGMQEEGGVIAEAVADATTGTVHSDGFQWSGDDRHTPSAQDAGAEAVPALYKAPRRFVGRRRAEEQRAGEGDAAAEASSTVVTAGGARARSRVVNAVPDEILHNEALNAMIAAQLPNNYSFEVHKTVWRLREAQARTVALQLPEGLQMFACALADIVGEFAEVEVVVLGDVTYGACCVDDLTARALGADMLVHYGHSCLVPIDSCCIKTMYVFVEIAVDMDHLVAAIKHNFDASKRLLLVGTVQFVSCIHKVRPTLEQHFASVAVPQSRPLSKGEVLGCTAPTIDAGSADVVIYVGDGRFHLEAIMIANPSLPYYRYDPYSKVISAEGYAHDQLHHNRKKAIAACSDAKVHRILKKSLFSVALYGIYTSLLTFENVGQGVRRHPGPFLLLLASFCTMRSQGGRALSACGAARAQSESERERGREGERPAGDKTPMGKIQGTLGRQGNPHVVAHVTTLLKAAGKSSVPVLLSEITPQKLATFEGIDAWVQIACPRVAFYKEHILSTKNTFDPQRTSACKEHILSVESTV